MTSGEWLDHAPEFFISMIIGMHVVEKKYAVYLDVFYKKVETYLGEN